MHRLSITLYLSHNLYLYFFFLWLLLLSTFLFFIRISIQFRFGWSVLRSDLLTVINELFRWFSRFHRLFFPSRLTSCYSSVRLFLLHALISRQPFRSPMLPCRPTSLSSIASASRNFLFSSFSVLLTPKFLSVDTERNSFSSAALHLLVSPPQRSTACLNKRINVSDYVSSHAVAFNPRADISNVSITVCSTCPLL